MPKPELLAAWVCRNGERVRRRKKAWAAVCITAAGLPAASCIFGNTLLWLLPCAALLVIAGCCLLYSAKKQQPQEEVLITSVKIFTEKKTWVLQDEKRRLTGVERSSSGLVFRGRETVSTGRQKSFTVRLPVPQQEQHHAEAICTFFRKQLAQHPAGGAVSG